MMGNFSASAMRSMSRSSSGRDGTSESRYVAISGVRKFMVVMFLGLSPELDARLAGVRHPLQDTSALHIPRAASWVRRRVDRRRVAEREGERSGACHRDASNA